VRKTSRFTAGGAAPSGKKHGKDGGTFWMSLRTDTVDADMGHHSGNENDGKLLLRIIRKLAFCH
jgi:hypothetical protein